MNEYGGISDVERDFWHDEPTRTLRRVPRSTLAATSAPAHQAPITRVRIHESAPGRSPSRLSTADPFVVRLAMMLLIGLVVALVVFAARRDGAGLLRTAPTGSAAAIPAAATGIVVLPVVAHPVVAAQPAAPLAESVEVAVPASAAAAPARVSSASASAAAAPAAAAPAATVPVHRACANPYTVVAGDYWIRIAKRSGVTTTQLLKANNATVTTKLFAGRTICLPAGATAPTTPAAAPATTVKPSGSKPAAPAAAPASTAPARTYSAAEVEAIIREVWPDELEVEALRIANRESNLRPTAKNFCCYGLFQIYYSVHKGWLAGIGVTSGDQLFDPRVNATAAYTLYQRAGGWGPWS